MPDAGVKGIRLNELQFWALSSRPNMSIYGVPDGLFISTRKMKSQKSSFPTDFHQ
jgi:hypothetical protein